MFNHYLQSGVAALFAVVLISAVGLIMALTASVLSLGELDLGWANQKTTEAFSAADGCIEETLRRLRLDPNYGVGLGDINLTLGNGSCIIKVDNLGGDSRRVLSASTVDVYHKKIEVQATVSNSIITVNSWSEKDN